MKYIWITDSERSPNCFWRNSVSKLLLIFTYFNFYRILFIYILYLLEKKRSFHLFTGKSIILPKKFRLMVQRQERINKINPLMERGREGFDLELEGSSAAVDYLAKIAWWRMIRRQSQSACRTELGVWQEISCFLLMFPLFAVGFVCVNSVVSTANIRFVRNQILPIITRNNTRARQTENL